IGEAAITADAELLAVAIEIMRECGLSAEDVRARVSDRRLLRALLRALGTRPDSESDVFEAIDKIQRAPEAATKDAWRNAGLGHDAIPRLWDLLRGSVSTADPLRVLDALAKD